MKIKKRYLSTIKNITKHAKIFMEEWYQGSTPVGLWSIYVFFNTPKYFLCSINLNDDYNNIIAPKIKRLKNTKHTWCYSKFRILLNNGLEERLLKVIHEYKKEI